MASRNLAVRQLQGEPTSRGVALRPSRIPSNDHDFVEIFKRQAETSTGRTSSFEHDEKVRRRIQLSKLSEVADVFLRVQLGGRCSTAVCAP
jgi:hypothetical protein